MPTTSDARNLPHKKNPKLTQLQERFAEEAARQYLETGIVNQTKAARDAGYSVKTADVMAVHNFRNEDVREHYMRCLDEAGVNDQKITRVLNEALDAKKTVVISAKQGLIDYEPDHATRMKAVQEYNKIKGVYKERSVSVDKRQAHIHLYADKNSAKLKELQNKLLEEASALGGVAGE